MGQNCCRFNVVAFGVAFGLMWGIGMLFLGFASHWFMWGTPLVLAMSSFYIGFDSTITGSLVGAFWGLCDGFIGGVILSWLYNKLSSKCSSSKTSCCAPNGCCSSESENKCCSSDKDQCPPK